LDAFLLSVALECMTSNVSRWRWWYASDVLDHHGLAKRDRQMVGKDTRDRVGDPARRYGHDDGDGARRIGLGNCDARHSRERGNARGQM
jgi:hypothetical protein